MPTNVTKQKTKYSDFFVNLNPHPAKKDLVIATNEQAVTMSIRNLLSTDKGERLYQPSIGSNIRSILFEPMGQATANALKRFIFETIDQYEPRAKIIETVVVPDYDKGQYNIIITYMLINNATPYIVGITFNRVR